MMHDRKNIKWQKELWQTFEETSGYVRPERVNKLPNRYMIIIIIIIMICIYLPL